MKAGIISNSFELLETMADSVGWRTVGELAAANRLAKPTCHRVLRCLHELGYVENNGSNAYQLSSKLRQLALGVDECWLTATAEPILRQLHNQTNETVSLGMLRLEKGVHLHILETSHALGHMVEIHPTTPFFSTALGQAIAAFEIPRRRDFLITHAMMDRGISKKIVDRNEIVRILKAVQENGYAIVHNQDASGETCVAVPIFYGSKLVGAINITAPTDQVDGAREASLLQLAMEAASNVSARLNHAQKATPWQLLPARRKIASL
jgi:DNA-binding IclR family transcriptional regulator